MSFTLSGSAHTDTQEDFEAVKDALQEAADAVGTHVSGGTFSFSLNGTDGSGQAFSETITTQTDAAGE